MATLTINFTISLNATKYRIKYRKAGTSGYTTVLVTSSPAVITGVDCGHVYEGTVESICTDGVPCNRYEITNTGDDSGTLEYVDCATGNAAYTDISPYMTFFVCSRTEPIPSGTAALQTGVQQVAQASCVSPSPEEASSPVYWTAPAITCPPTVYYYSVSVCPSSINTTLPPNNEVKSNTPISIGTVVQLTGVPYVDGCYTITDLGSLQTSAVTVAQTFSNCNACLA